MGRSHNPHGAHLISGSPDRSRPTGSTGSTGSSGHGDSEGDVDERDLGSRAVVTLSPPVAARVREMADAMGGATSAEVVRRGLILLDLVLSLPEEEELVIRNDETETYDRIRFAWDMAIRSRRG